MTSEKKKLMVADRLAGSRLDVGLTVAGVTISRAQAHKLIQEQLVWVNNKVEKPSYKLQLGDVIHVDIPPPKKMDLIPYDFPLDVVYEDEEVIVVNKPAGLVVHPAYGHESDTLINALLARNTHLAPSGTEEFRPGLVHRIDKGTSGLLVLAKTETSHNFLARQFQKKTIHRRYWALCFSHKDLNIGTLDNFLTRDPKNRQRFMTSQDEKGKRAITHYEVLKKTEIFRLFQLKLETGRTHQIRVQLSSEGNPIVGDDVYNGKNLAKNLKNQELKKLILEMNRFALHAKELGFVHPKTKKTLSFGSQIPEDLHRLFELGGFPEFI